MRPLPLPDSLPHREIYFNIGLERMFIYFFMALMLAVFFAGIVRVMRLWALGRPEMRTDRLLERLGSVWVFIVGQRRVRREASAGSMHLLVFFGFTILVIATAIVALEDWAQLVTKHSFLNGVPYLVYSLFADIGGLMLVVGIVWAIVRRYVRPARRLLHQPTDAIHVAALLFFGVSGFFIEGFRIAITELDTHRDWAAWSPVGTLVAFAVQGLGEPMLRAAHRFTYWSHITLVFAWLAYIPYSKMAHILYAPLNAFFVPLKPKGALTPIPAWEFETAETFGVGKLEEFNWKDLLDLSTCMECGRCEEWCPASVSEKPLSPRRLITSLRDYMLEVGPALVTHQPIDVEKRMVGDIILDDVLWSCTTCRYCQETCPVMIEHVDKIIDMRRYLVLTEARIPEAVQTTLANIERRGHPWRGTQHTRTDWFADLGLKTLAEWEGEPPEVLFWVGCTGALVDRNIQVTRAIVEVLQTAGVRFGILGAEETCTGDPARRMGNELLFQMQAQQVIATLEQHGVTKILTGCPHCFNTFSSEYPQLGGRYEVMHHSQFINELIASGRLTVERNADGTVTYHDSCYLGRYNGVYDQPRAIVDAVGMQRVEMALSRDRGMCCGAGGGHAFMSMSIGERVNYIRAQQALDTGAQAVAVACPFCMQMFDDGLRAKGAADQVKLYDVAELVAKSMVKKTSS